MKKNVFKIIIAVTLTAILISAGFVSTYFFYLKPNNDVTLNALTTLQDVMQSNLTTVYIALNDIKAGDVLDDTNLYTEEQYINRSVALFTSDDLGKTAVVDIRQNEAVTKMMAKTVEAETDNKTIKYDYIILSPNLKKGMEVDIRIRFNTGENKVILSKKEIIDITDGNTSCYLSLKNDEILLMSSALYDCEKYGAEIYAVLYTNFAQNSAEVNYIPVIDVMDDLTETTLPANCIELRQNLNNRMEQEGKDLK